LLERELPWMASVRLPSKKLCGKRAVVTVTRTENVAQSSDRRTLRDQVEELLPTWRSWYPSLFDAAADLGLIRARVCSPSSLMLSNRHASVQSEALQMFKEQWSVEDEPEEPQLPIRLQRQQTPRKPFKKKPRPSY
jgi:hypothetical protein